MGGDLPCSCHDTQTLQTIETLVKRRWKKEWPSEDMWNEAYEEALKQAQLKGERATVIFLDQCGLHAWEGRNFLDSIREIVHTSCPYCRERLKYDTVLLYDLLVSIVSEVKFFEAKVGICNI
jgi:hypothetical protein